MQAAAGFQHTGHLLQGSAGVGQRLDHVAADHQVELGVVKGEPQRVLPLELRAGGEARVARAGAFEVRLLEIYAQVGGLREKAQEP